MNIFKFVNNKLIISPEDVLIPEVNLIWERDKSKDKEVARQELTYIYLISDWNSIYRNYPEAHKDTIIRKDFIKIPKWEPDKAVKEAIKRLEDHQNQSSNSMRLLKSTKNAVEKLSEYFDGIDFTERDEKGQPVYKINEVTRAMESSGKVLQSLETLTEKVEKERSMSSSKIIGGGSINKFES
jgi:hypothetical protein